MLLLSSPFVFHSRSLCATYTWLLLVWLAMILTGTAIFSVFISISLAILPPLALSHIRHRIHYYKYLLRVQLHLCSCILYTRCKFCSFLLLYYTSLFQRAYYLPSKNFPTRFIASIRWLRNISVLTILLFSTL